MRIIKGPYLQWPTADTMTVMWETSVEASGEVAYCETERQRAGLDGRFRTLEETEKTVEAPCARRIHRVELTGLSEDTTYHYRVRSRGDEGEVVESERLPLKTAVGQDRPFAFALTSETGGYGDDSVNQELFAQLSRHRPEFLIVVGDSVKDGRKYEDWERYLFGPGQELFETTPFYLCLGNHEENGSWFYEFVSYPEPKNYYSFDYGNSHFVALDCTAGEDRDNRKNRMAVPGDGFLPGTDQYNFLVEDLKASHATWKFVFFHYPPYVSGDYQIEEMRILSPVFEQHGVDIVFSSHTIVYERSHPITAGKLDLDSGVRYIVVGGAGERQAWFNNKFAWHTAHAVAVPHFVQVAVAGQLLELRAIDKEGRLFDTLTMTRKR